MVVVVAAVVIAAVLLVVVVVVAVVVCSRYGVPKPGVGVVVAPHLDVDREVVVEPPVLSLPALALGVVHRRRCHLVEVVAMSLVWLGEKD